MSSVLEIDTLSSVDTSCGIEPAVTLGEPMRTMSLDPGLEPPFSVLFIDDEPNALDGFRRMLRPFAASIKSHFLSDSRKALAEIVRLRIEVVVTDLLMSSVSGVDLVHLLRKCPETQYIPVIVVTGQHDRQLKRQALDAGAADLLTKPIEFEDLLARIRSAFRLKRCYDELNYRNAELESRVAERTEQLQRSRLEMIARLGKAAEYRDSDTGLHVIRVAHYSRLVALQLGLSESEADLIFTAAQLHDVGKIAIPDSILLKTGILTDAERRVMQRHCAVGERILSDSVDLLLRNRCKAVSNHHDTMIPWTDPILPCAREIAASHHEHWNGGGYPRGLAGEDIPLAGRIVAIADVFDALTTVRPHKAALPTAMARQIISNQAGKQFDPRVYKAFIAATPQIEVVRLQLQDNATG